MRKLGFLYLLMWSVEAILPLKKPYEASFVSWNATAGSAWDFHLRLLGRERRMNGSIYIWEDITDDHFTFAMDTYSDVGGNYKLYPISLPEDRACKFLGTYWSYCKDSVQFGVHTDCPFEACPLPKGHYYMRDVQIDTTRWPLILPRGFFKFVLTVRKDGKVIATQILVIEIRDIPYP